MNEPVKATRQFSADFSSVARHYKCTESEIETMKQLARADMTAAVESFGLMAMEAA